jgi:hypothetical protein
MYRLLFAVLDRKQHAKSSFLIEYSTMSQCWVHEQRAVTESYHPMHTRPYLDESKGTVDQRGFGRFSATSNRPSSITKFGLNR